MRILEYCSVHIFILQINTGELIWFVKEYALDTRLLSLMELAAMQVAKKGVKFVSFLLSGTGYGVRAVDTD